MLCQVVGCSKVGLEQEETCHFGQFQGALRLGNRKKHVMSPSFLGALRSEGKKHVMRYFDFISKGP